MNPVGSAKAHALSQGKQASSGSRRSWVAVTLILIGAFVIAAAIGAGARAAIGDQLESTSELPTMTTTQGTTETTEERPSEDVTSTTSAPTSTTLSAAQSVMESLADRLEAIDQRMAEVDAIIGTDPRSTPVSIRGELASIETDLDAQAKVALLENTDVPSRIADAFELLINAADAMILRIQETSAGVRAVIALGDDKTHFEAARVAGDRFAEYFAEYGGALALAPSSVTSASTTIVTSSTTTVASSTTTILAGPMEAAATDYGGTLTVPVGWRVTEGLHDQSNMRRFDVSGPDGSRLICITEVEWRDWASYNDLSYYDDLSYAQAVEDNLRKQFPDLVTTTPMARKTVAGLDTLYWENTYTRDGVPTRSVNVLFQPSADLAPTWIIIRYPVDVADSVKSQAMGILESFKIE